MNVSSSWPFFFHCPFHRFILRPQGPVCIRLLESLRVQLKNIHQSEGIFRPGTARDTTELLGDFGCMKT